MNKVYVSGKVTGDPFYKQKFKAAEKYLKSKGFKVVNPVKWSSDGKDWKYYMYKDIKKLMKCDIIYLLPDWGYSKGAQLEYTIANAFDFNVLSGKWSDLIDYGFDYYKK